MSWLGAENVVMALNIPQTRCLRKGSMDPAADVSEILGLSWAAWNGAAEVLDPLRATCLSAMALLANPTLRTFATATPSGRDANNYHARYFGAV